MYDPTEEKTYISFALLPHEDVGIYASEKALEMITASEQQGWEPLRTRWGSGWGWEGGDSQK